MSDTYLFCNPIDKLTGLGRSSPRRASLLPVCAVVAALLSACVSGGEPRVAPATGTPVAAVVNAGESGAASVAQGTPLAQLSTPEAQIHPRESSLKDQARVSQMPIPLRPPPMASPAPMANRGGANAEVISGAAVSSAARSPYTPPVGVAPVAMAPARNGAPPQRSYSAPATGYEPRPGMGYPPSENTAKYPSFRDTPWSRVSEQPVSTFSASVDTGSYANVRRFVSAGQMPPKDAVRVEELVNYFGYDYPDPPRSQAHPFAVNTQLSRSPWNAERGVLRIAIKARDAAKASLPPSNLVFLVDVSGSMSSSDRLPLVQSSLKLLAQQLRPQDRVSLVTYANGTGVVLPATPGDQKTKIQLAIDSLSAGGGTFGAAGIRLAYQQATEAFIKGGINRVLLATDGDLNVGEVDPEALKVMVEKHRKAGVSLTTLGVGDSNYNEVLMKKLADAGDGSYHYLDSLQEAHKVLVHEMTSTLAVLAQDLKLQIEFNPALASEYRLIGYEMNALTREQFNDDQVDAGDVGAGHTVTALYEWIPRGAKGSVDPLRYQKAKDDAQPGSARLSTGPAELAWIKLRYKNPGEGESQLIEFPITQPARLPEIEQADREMGFAVAVAAWGQWLRGGTLIGDYGPRQISELASQSRGTDRFGRRAEFLRLVELSAALSR
jgi:Ca-activated chloride channel family protein